MTKRAVLRRCIGAAACLSPIALLLVSLAVGIARPRDSTSGLGLMALATAVAAANAWLSHGRGWLHLRRGGTMETYRHSSGVPLGTPLIVIAGLAGFGAVWTAVLGLVALAIDTGGSPWFLAAVWKDASFWDASAFRDARDED